MFMRWAIRQQARPCNANALWGIEFDSAFDRLFRSRDIVIKAEKREPERRMSLRKSFIQLNGLQGCSLPAKASFLGCEINPPTQTRRGNQPA